MTRAFIAIRPPEGVLDAIEARFDAVAIGRGRPARRDQWHITLQFLGDDVDLAAAAGAFRAEPLDLGPGKLRLSGADTFGNRRRARILMLGVCEGAAWLGALAAEVERRMASVGHGRDAREGGFVPHLTLARYRTPTDLRRVCATVGFEPVGPSWRAGEVVLFESELRPDGARHLVRECFGTVPG